MPKIFFVKGNVKTSVDAKIGQSLLDVAKENNINLFGACDGSCACGTCHVYIDHETLKKIDPASNDEENVLDVVFNLQDNSRLACQVIVNDQMDGATITIPD